jgi:hypothetical protein
VIRQSFSCARAGTPGPYTGKKLVAPANPSVGSGGDGGISFEPKVFRNYNNGDLTFFEFLTPALVCSIV